MTRLQAYTFYIVICIVLYMTTERRVVLDLTQGNEPVITYTDVPVRQPLADITGRRTGRRRARQIDEEQNSESEENVDNSTQNRLRGRRQRRRAEQSPPLNLQEGIGVKPLNPWIQHVKSFAKQHGITYWKALKSPQCKSSYK